MFKRSILYSIASLFLLVATVAVLVFLANQYSQIPEPAQNAADSQTTTTTLVYHATLPTSPFVKPGGTIDFNNMWSPISATSNPNYTLKGKDPYLNPDAVSPDTDANIPIDEMLVKIPNWLEEELDLGDANDLGNGWYRLPEDRINELPDDVKTEPVHWVHISDQITTNVTYPNQWALKNSNEYGTGAQSVWNVTTGSGIVVAVIDSGVQNDHPDLQNQIWSNVDEICENGKDDDGNGYIDDCRGWDFVTDTPQTYHSPMEDRHGTHVAGIIAAQNNNSGSVGIAPGAKIMPLRFIAGTQGRTDDALEAIAYAVNNGADVINVSWGSPEPSQALHDQISWAVSKGVVVVIAAGNQSADLGSRPFYPAADAPQGAIVVASHDADGGLSPFSNTGRRVDLSAPGGIIYSTLPANSHGYMSGTSMSAPQVSGAVALWLAKHANSSPKNTAGVIAGSAYQVPGLAGKTASGGIVDIAAALGLNNAPPGLTITAQPSVVSVGQTIALDAETNLDVSKATMLWEMPDGSIISGFHITTTLTRPGDNVVIGTIKQGSQETQRTITITVSDLVGDFFEEPLPYEDGAYQTIQATTQDDEVFLCAPVGNTLWFDLGTLPQTEYTFDTNGSNFDTVLAIVDADTRSVVACSDDVREGEIRTSIVTAKLSSERNLLLVVGGFDGESGVAMLNSAQGSQRAKNLITGPSVAQEGSVVEFKTETEHMLLLEGTRQSSAKSLEVTFDISGTYRILLVDKTDETVLLDAHTIEILNTAPVISNIVVTRNTSDAGEGATNVTFEVFDAGGGTVMTELSIPSRAPVQKTAQTTPQTLTLSTPQTSGWGVLYAGDSSGAVVSQIVYLGTQGEWSGTNPGDLNGGDLFNAGPAVAKGSFDVDGDGVSETVSLRGEPDTIDVYVDNVKSGSTSQDAFNMLLVRGMTIAKNFPRDLWIVSAHDAVSVDIVRWEASKDGQYSTTSIITVAKVSPLDVSGIQVSGIYPDVSILLVRFDGAVLDIEDL